MNQEYPNCIKIQIVKNLSFTLILTTIFCSLVLTKYLSALNLILAAVLDTYLIFQSLILNKIVQKQLFHKFTGKVVRNQKIGFGGLSFDIVVIEDKNNNKIAIKKHYLRNLRLEQQITCYYIPTHEDAPITKDGIKIEENVLGFESVQQ